MKVPPETKSLNYGRWDENWQELTDKVCILERYTFKIRKVSNVTLLPNKKAQKRWSEGQAANRDP